MDEQHLTGDIILPDALDTDENGYIKCGEDCLTSVPGLFAAGDCRTKSLRQLVTAAADGAHVSECRIHDVFALKLRSFRCFFCGSFFCLFLGYAVLSLEQISDLS